jgi:ribosomal-protein-alanine N-acetyltransferase
MSNLRQLKLPLHGTRVLVRSLEVNDIPTLYEIESDPVVKRYMDDPVTIERELWIAEMSEQCLLFNSTLAVCLAATGEFMGRASLRKTEPFATAVELQIVFGRAWCRNGYGPETASLLIDAAFDQMGASAVEATTHPENRGSLSILQRFRFEQIEVLSRAGWQNGHVRHALRKSVHNYSFNATVTCRGDNPAPGAAR